MPLLFTLVAPLHHGADDIVALLEDVGVDDNFLAGCPLDGIAPTLDLGPEVLDDDRWEKCAHGSAIP